MKEGAAEARQCEDCGGGQEPAYVQQHICWQLKEGSGLGVRRAGCCELIDRCPTELIVACTAESKRPRQDGDEREDAQT